MSALPLAGKIAIVTGATRGIGKGISVQLAQNGAKVYITGRTLRSKDNQPGSLESTVEEIASRGGLAIPVQVDHEKPEQVKDLFDKVNKDEKGQLDVLVNNAYKGVSTIFNSRGNKFYDNDVKQWDDINNVGLRNHYICSVYASRLMVAKKHGLIVNISSPAGQMYLFNVPYGIGKNALDRMAIDCGMELKRHNVGFLSLVLGAVRTETMMDDKTREGQNEAFKKMFEDGETVEFSGKIISHMATNPKIMKFSSRIVNGADYANKYGILDIDGKKVESTRSFKSMSKYLIPKSFQGLAQSVPSCVKVPSPFLTVMSSKYYKF